MLSTTLQKGLTSYGVGGKIRALRLRKKMGLVELGNHSGMSPALLSKIERGLVFPTLPTLLRIALVFSVGLEYFFAGSREKPVAAVSRKTERVRLPEKAGARDGAYRFESLDYGATERRFNSYYAEFTAASDKHKPHQHAGVEFIYMIEGVLALRVGADDYELSAGDAMYFDSMVPHSYRRAGARSCAAVVVTAP